MRKRQWTRFNVEWQAGDGSWQIAGTEGLNCMTERHAQAVMEQAQARHPRTQFRVTPHHNKPAWRPNYR